MSGVMVKVALYGLIRVQFEWLGAPPQWLGYALLGRRRRVRARRRAVGAGAAGPQAPAGLQHDRERRDSSTTVARRVGAAAHATRRVARARVRGGAVAHRQPRGDQGADVPRGAGAIERATGTLDLDRLGGLLRRMPWTGATFAVGCAGARRAPAAERASSSEWLTLQSLAGLAMDGAARRRPGGRGCAGRRGGDRRARAALLRRRSPGSCCWAPPRVRLRAADPPRGHARGAYRARRACASRSASRRGCCSTPSAELAPGARARSRSTRRALAGCPRAALAAALVPRRRRPGAVCAASAARAAGADVGVRPAADADAGLDVSRVHEAAAARAGARAAPAPRARDRRVPADVVQGIRYARDLAITCSSGCSMARRFGRRCAAPASPVASRPATCARTPPTSSRCVFALLALVRAGGAGERRARRVQLGGGPGAAAAGHVQTLKARACRVVAARRRCSHTAICGGCGARARVDPEPEPARSTGLRRRWSRRLPARRDLARPGRRSRRAAWASAHDAFVLVGLLALARFAIAAAAWDTGSGFALMGAARDLTLAVFARGAVRARAAARRSARARAPTWSR